MLWRKSKGPEFLAIACVFHHNQAIRSTSTSFKLISRANSPLCLGHAQMHLHTNTQAHKCIRNESVTIAWLHGFRCLCGTIVIRCLLWSLICWWESKSATHSMLNSSSMTFSGHFFSSSPFLSSLSRELLLATSCCLRPLPPPAASLPGSALASSTAARRREHREREDLQWRASKTEDG